jgi:hypothetical protein
VIPSLTAPFEVKDVQVAWRAAALDVQRAYSAWCDAEAERAGEAYAVFVAAVDREAAAADAVSRVALDHAARPRIA